MGAIPLTVLPLIAYNLIGYGVSGADPWATVVVSVPMPSGARLALHLGDLMVVFAIGILCLEMLRIVRSAGGRIMNRTLAIVVTAAYVFEFLVADVAAHPVFFALTVIAVLEVFTGAGLRRARARRVDLEEGGSDDDLL